MTIPKKKMTKGMKILVATIADASNTSVGLLSLIELNEKRKYLAWRELKRELKSAGFINDEDLRINNELGIIETI